MAEAAAVFYAAETAVEGAVLGGLAVKTPTVPLHIKFQKITSPSPSLALSNHSLSIIKNRAYIFGGDHHNGEPNSDIQCITLPTDLAQADLSIDYQVIKSEAAPERPLAPYSDDPNLDPPSIKPNEIPTPRAAHAAAVVGSNIYIFGGRPSSTSSNPTSAKTDPSHSSPLQENGIVHAFSTITSKWTTLYPSLPRCSSGLPSPRYSASLSSSPHPLPSKSPISDPQMDADTEHNSGTLFLHSGYSNDSTAALRDVWAYDISSHVWSRWADIPSPSPHEIAGEGRMLCFESRLWRAGDGFGVVHYLDIVRDAANDAWGDAGTELGVSPKTGVWEKLTFDAEKTSAAPSQTKHSNETPGEEDAMARADALPEPRCGAGFFPVTTGAGREYLLYLFGSDSSGSVMGDVWSFQIPSLPRTLAKAKDFVRGAVGKSGENEWARCEVVQGTKEDGESERPRGGLVGFAGDVWRDWGGGTAVLWGGRKGEGEGWVMSIE